MSRVWSRSQIRRADPLPLKVIKSEQTTTVKSDVTLGAVEWDLGEEVELWWPVREGKQTRYQVKVELLSEVSDAPPP